MTKKELDVIIQLAKLKLRDMKENKSVYMAIVILTDKRSLLEVHQETEELISNLESAIPKLEHLKRIARE